MLIDQFTEEQIAQIKRELKEIQGKSKGIAGRIIKDKVHELFDFKSYCNAGLFPYAKVTDSIVAIINCTLDNYIYRRGEGREKINGKRFSVGWYVNNVIPDNMYDEYMQIADEILKVIQKHRKAKEFPFETPAAKK